MAMKINEEYIVPEVKKRKKHIILRIFLIILLVVIVIPVTLSYTLFFDPNSKEVKVSPDVTKQQIGEKILFHCLDYTASDKVISVRLSEDDLDQFLYFGSQQMPEQARNFFPKLYIEIDPENEKYNFFLDARVPMFASRLKISTFLIEDDDKLTFEIESISIGRISGLDWIAQKIIDKKMIDDLFASAGLHLTFDLVNMRLIYTFENLIKDLKAFAPGGEGNIFFDLFQTFIEKQMLNVHSIQIEDYKALAFDMDLTNCISNTYTNAHYAKVHNITQDVMPTIVSGLNDGSISPNDTAVTNAIKTKFKEVYPSKNVDIKQKVIDNLPQGPYSLDTEYTVRVYENDINDFLYATNAVPTITPLYMKNGNTYEVSYAIIDDLYADFFKNNENKEEADFVMSLNLNGLSCSISLHSLINDSLSTSTKMAMEIQDVSLGNLELSNELVEKFVDIIARSFDGSGTPSFSIQKDPSTGKYIIYIDMKTMVEDAVKDKLPVVPGKTIIINTVNNLYGTSKDDNDENAGFKFTFSASLMD